jgi:hypothetical protein
MQENKLIFINQSEAAVMWREEVVMDETKFKILSQNTL